MSRPEGPHGEERPERPGGDRETSPPRPPGEFLTDDLASATARFLDEVKRRVRRAAEVERRPPSGRAG